MVFLVCGTSFWVVLVLIIINAVNESLYVPYSSSRTSFLYKVSDGRRSRQKQEKIKFSRVCFVCVLMNYKNNISEFCITEEALIRLFFVLFLCVISKTVSIRNRPQISLPILSELKCINPFVPNAPFLYPWR